MSKFAQWYLLGVAVPVLSIHLITILSTSNKSNKTSSNHDSGECVLISRREYQNKTASPSPSTSEGPTTPLPSSLPLPISGTGSTSTSTNGGA